MNEFVLLQAILRQDFHAFARRVFREVAAGEEFSPNWHLEAMCYVLSEIGQKNRRRQIIEVPPRSLKSICASVALVAWLLGHDPTRKIICISYSEDLAFRFSAMTRLVMKSEWYRSLFPATEISPTKDTEGYFRTTAGGYRDATSVGGTLTGKGADLIIIDDPGKANGMMSEPQRNAVNEWFDHTLRSRLNNKKRDGILLVMQRLHYDDLAGYVRRKGGWDVLTIPAIAPKGEIVPLDAKRSYIRRAGELIDVNRESQEEYDSLKADIGSFTFSAQYQQDPLPETGSVIDWRWFRSFGIAPSPGRSRIVQSWDCASKKTEFSDYSVCMTWAVLDDQYFLLDVYRKRVNFPELIAAAKQLAEQWRPDEVLVEDAAAGIQLCQLLRLDRPIRMPEPIDFRADHDKVTRALTATPAIERGSVFLPINAPWLDDFKTEILQFPFGTHDDQIDSMTQFLAYEHRKRLRGRIIRVSMFGHPNNSSQSPQRRS